MAIKLGKPKHKDKITLKDLQSFPLWTSVYLEWDTLRPVVSRDPDVTKEVLKECNYAPTILCTGEVTLTSVPGTVSGDFSGNGIVDVADYVVWRKNYGTPTSYDPWRTHFGQPAGSGAGARANAAVPEPTTLVLFLVGTLTLLSRRRDAVA